MLKTWLEISESALKHNIKTIRSLLAPKTQLWAVVKSNAYGHGLILFSRLADKLGVDPVRNRARAQARPEGALGRAISNGVDGFCVDSVVEGLKLRKNGIRRPILVLGPTLPGNFINQAVKHKITLSISTFEALEQLARQKNKPEFHIKIDTGMHRQGFYLRDLEQIAKEIRNPKFEIRNKLKGIFTHFAAAKNINEKKITDYQFNEFQKAVKIFEQAGFTNLIKHCSATGGTLLGKKYHLDAVRCGIGLYGLWPSEELRKSFINSQSSRHSRDSHQSLHLKPVLSWHAVVSEIKNLKPGDRVGYDLTERIAKPSKMAIIPIGYWHGFDRGLSGIGEVLIQSKRARVLGRVSMDLIAVDVTGINCKVGDVATLLGKNGQNEITASELGDKIKTSNYEIVTRINPLIARILSR